MECKAEQNRLACTCSYGCPKSGICCECVAHHRENGEIPGCFSLKRESGHMTDL